MFIQVLTDRCTFCHQDVCEWLLVRLRKHRTTLRNTRKIYDSTYTRSSFRFDADPRPRPLVGHSRSCKWIQLSSIRWVWVINKYSRAITQRQSEYATFSSLCSLLIVIVIHALSAELSMQNIIVNILYMYVDTNKECAVTLHNITTLLHFIFLNINLAIHFANVLQQWERVELWI